MELIKTCLIVIRIENLDVIGTILGGSIVPIILTSITVLYRMDGNVLIEGIVLLMKMEERIVNVLLLMDIRLIKAGYE
ncbi:hypothetical protein [uncultured Clostridium sp.]|uniref:hypothetical protein n=1 Tax=uncultured Clostridium sp. TaxID=59620 RepID=UPI0025F7B99B|nr:hypothetical protein [uncultured Clostridium sp.]